KVSIELGIPLFLAVVRKVTYPWTTEAGFGAISWLEDVVVDERNKAAFNEREYLRCLEKAKESVQKRAELFKAFLPKTLNGLKVSIIDDGLATGYTMVAAVKAARKLGAREVTATVPTSSISAAYFVLEYVDSLVVLNIRTWLPYSVADAYRNWVDITESEVLTMLNCLREKGLA
ncbi:MAG: phosphoribosyltransferase family protein, partial [Thermofilaceae archaeon]